MLWLAIWRNRMQPIWKYSAATSYTYKRQACQAKRHSSIMSMVMYGFKRILCTYLFVVCTNYLLFTMKQNLNDKNRPIRCDVRMDIREKETCKISVESFLILWMSVNARRYSQIWIQSQFNRIFELTVRFSCNNWFWIKNYL